MLTFVVNSSILSKFLGIACLLLVVIKRVFYRNTYISVHAIVLENICKKFL